MQSPPYTKKRLGEITVPSGTVLLIDFGLMDLWTHDRPPLILPGILSDDALESANNGSDFKIEGPDAAEAGRRFGRQPNPHYLYDIPRHGVEELRESFESSISQAGFRSNLVALAERVPPRRRVEQALEFGQGAGVVFLHGVHSIVVSGLPRDRALIVEGRAIDSGEFHGHWQDISLLVSDSEIARSLRIGYVAVDMARLMFCDVEAAGKWQHHETIDGLADLVFWGKDAARLANKFSAPILDGHIYGFVDMPIQESIDLAMRVQSHLDQHHLVAAMDFRPHTDHWRMLKELAGHETESGVIQLGDSHCCGFMTGWGDGFFPVYLELDAAAKIVAVRIELATEETKKGMRRVNNFA
ncbi:MAG: DUF4241 domain-containing protein [Candidatus Obscuribacterales bacterium]|nr:DUF4241 domain-containing protein [Candidatus Obscuribacterales bacterium]